MQSVSPSYPEDASTPLWAGHFDRYLRGTIHIPLDLVQSGESYMLYVEVRDFQRNVLVGSTKLQKSRDRQSVVVKVE